MRQLTTLLVACLVAIGLTSCNPISPKLREAYMQAYFLGNVEESEEILRNGYSKKDTSFRKDPNAIWFRLESGTLRFIQGKEKLAVQDYSVAVDASDYYLQDSTGEDIATYLISDEAAAFQGDGFEQSLLRLYFAFALFQSGDNTNGLALLKQIRTFYELHKEYYNSSTFFKGQHPFKNALGAYLLGVHLLKQGDVSNAKILFKEAKELFPSLSPSAEKALFTTTKNTKEQGTLLVICHNGNAPYKISESAAPSLEAITTASALFTELGNTGGYASLASITHIQTPELRNWPDSNPIPTSVTVSGKARPLVMSVNIDQTAHESLQEALPLIQARALVRYAMRLASAEVAKQSDGLFGDLYDLGMFVANRMTKADIRSWNTLPYSIDLMRWDLSPGEHTVTVNQHTSTGDKTYSLPNIEIKKGEIRMIHLFNIHPNVFRFLVPKA